MLIQRPFDYCWRFAGDATNGVDMHVHAANVAELGGNVQRIPAGYNQILEVHSTYNTQLIALRRHTSCA